MRKLRNLFVGTSEEREDGEREEREGEGTQSLSLSSGTHRIHNSLAEHADRMPGVELREPRNLCVCVSEERGHGLNLSFFIFSRSHTASVGMG